MSQRLMAGWCGVLAEGHRPCLQIGVTQESAHKRGRSAEAGPVVVPQRRNQPGMISLEHQVRQVACPERPAVTRTPGRGLFRSRLDQHVMPPVMQGHFRCVGEDDVIDACVEIPQPPSLVRRLLRQQREDGPIMLDSFFSVRHHDGGAGLKDRRDGGGDGPADGRADGDPRNLGVGPDPPRAAVPGPRHHAASLEAQPKQATALAARVAVLRIDSSWTNSTDRSFLAAAARC